ncbi:protein TIFY 10A isoform X1 [Quercus robur]|uniref:protein TIFY 10A isoform X1 n=1 Tax=Quercus robur TaxID=38942 RepID=UPI0021629320|nr:protein TIFY 10A isoform X1 [Quercus robur]
MTSSSEFCEFSGQRQGKLPEKASFSQRCSLLSQYLKEKGSFGDLSLGMTCNIESNGTPEMYRQSASTMNLFPVNEKLSDVSGQSEAANRNLQSIDLFPQPAGFTTPFPKEEVPKIADSRLNKPATAEPEKAQMTIFYGGQVIVFNDFPADKAKEVMLLASKGTPQSHNTPFASNPATNNQPAFAPNLARNSAESSTSIATSSSGVVPPNFGNKVISECAQPSPQPLAADLPIARRASLHRFLEKRKDRITAKAPYQINNPEEALPTKPAESKPWLGLAAQLKQ